MLFLSLTADPASYRAAADKIAADLQAARQALADAVAESLANPERFSSEALANGVNEIAKFEGMLEVIEMATEGIGRAAERGVSAAEWVQNLAFKLISNGADDRWSGRTNDRQRSYFDGKLEMAREVYENAFQLA